MCHFAQDLSVHIYLYGDHLTGYDLQNLVRSASLLPHIESATIRGNRAFLLGQKSTCDSALEFRVRGPDSDYVFPWKRYNEIIIEPCVWNAELPVVYDPARINRALRVFSEAFAFQLASHILVGARI